MLTNPFDIVHVFAVMARASGASSKRRRRVA
jgi:hypothetical protein